MAQPASLSYFGVVVSKDLFATKRQSASAAKSIKEAGAYPSELALQAGDQAVFQRNIRDITECKAAEGEMRRLNEELEQRVADRTAQLKSSNEELEALSHSISRDLRAPLREILRFVSLLKPEAEPFLPEKGLHYLTTISQSAKQMGDLIDDLLAFSRAGQSEMQKTEINLHELTEETLQDFATETKGRNIAWNIHGLPVVRADRALLRLVLGNLISNALKFTADRLETKIEIGRAPNGSDKVIIFVRDNGAGFDQKHADKLFHAFQRLHSQAEFEGTGIGLANVKRIIHRHGGLTWADGRVDGGATFYFSIPK